MFLRKLVVIFLPLVMVLLICLLLPLLSGAGFLYWAVAGLLLGIALALVLPLSGATRMREPFGYLLWVPALVLILVVLFQGLTVNGGADIPVLSLLTAATPSVILVECAFIGFLMTTVIRTKT